MTPDERRRHESTKWLARLERGLRQDDGPQFREWLEDAKNREVILDAASLWHSSDVHVLLCRLMGVSPRQTRSVRPKRTLTLPLTIALVSTVGLLAILLTGRMPWSHGASSPEKAPRGTVYATAVGETRQVRLPDGTDITLNTGTRVSVSFSNRVREVHLMRGEASFHVVPDGTRPFHVNAGRRQFEAAHTRFNLRTLTSENVELTVTEGQVKVMDAPPRLPDTPARRRDPITYGEAVVGAFEEALVEPGFQLVSPIEKSEVDARLAWQDGLIIVRDKALADALAEVERYTQTKFVLADAALSTLRVSGRFRTGNVNAVRLALRQNFLVASRRDTRGRIVLSPLHRT
jgi:transmembrane sensor